MKCPKCGHEIKTQQSKAALSRWSKLSAAQRATEMSNRRKKGIKNSEKNKRNNRQGS
jgi:hypothetical protein